MSAKPLSCGFSLSRYRVLYDYSHTNQLSPPPSIPRGAHLICIPSKGPSTYLTSNLSTTVTAELDCGLVYVGEPFYLSLLVNGFI